MSNPVIEIIGNVGKYDGTYFKVEVVGSVVRIEYNIEALEGKNDLTSMFENATGIAKQIKTLTALH